MNIGDRVRIAHKPFFMTDLKGRPDYTEWESDYGAVGFETEVVATPTWVRGTQRLAEDVMAIRGPVGDVVVISLSCLEKV